jgi:hypothetical protein
MSLLLYCKQALKTQHLFDWQLHSSAVRLISSRELLGMWTRARFLREVKFKTVRTATMYSSVNRLITSLTCLQENDVQFH